MVGGIRFPWGAPSSGPAYPRSFLSEENEQLFSASPFFLTFVEFSIRCVCCNPLPNLVFLRNGRSFVNSVLPFKIQSSLVKYSRTSLSAGDADNLYTSRVH